MGQESWSPPGVLSHQFRCAAREAKWAWRPGKKSCLGETSVLVVSRADSVHRSGESKGLGEAPTNLLPTCPADPESVLWASTELDAGVWGSLSH